MISVEAYITGSWTDITSYLRPGQSPSLDINTSARINEFKFNIIKTFETDVTPIVDDMQIRVKNGSTELFAGTIHAHKSNSQTGQYECVAQSHATLFLNVNLIEYYQNRTPEYIFADWISKYTDFTYTPSTSSGINIEELTIIDKTLDEAITGLCNLTGYAVRVDSAKNVYFEPLGITDLGMTFQTGSGQNIFGLPNWYLDTDNTINKIDFEGGTQRFDKTEYFNGDGSTTTFTLTYPPDDVSVYIGTALKTPFVSGATGTGDYSVVKEDKNIIFQASSIPPIGTANVTVYYTYSIPIRIEQQSDPGLTPSQIRFKRITNKSIKTMADGRRFIKNIFTQFGVDTPTADDVVVRFEEAIVPNSRARFIDSISGLNVNQQLIINKLKYTFPEDLCVLSVGQQSTDFIDNMKELSDKIKDLQAQLGSNTLTQKYISEKTSLKIKVRAVTSKAYYRLLNDSFIFGGGEWGLFRDPAKAFVISDFEAVGNWTSNIDQLSEQSLNTGGSTTTPAGFRVYTNKNCNLISITKDASCNATRALLKTDTGNTTIASATFSGNTATFSSPQALTAGTYYKLEADNSGSSYTYRGRTTGLSLPYINNYLNITNGSVNGSTNANIYNLISATTSGATVTLDTTNYKTGSASLKMAMTVGTDNLKNITDSIDISGSVGASSGNPTKGCIGLWLRDSNKKVTNMTLKIGSDASNYVLINAKSYPIEWDDFYTEDFFTYYVFKFLDGAVTGTPNWTAVDYIKFDITVSDTTDVNVDFLTISDSNYIGFNVLGDRRGAKIEVA